MRFVHRLETRCPLLDEKMVFQTSWFYLRSPFPRAMSRRGGIAGQKMVFQNEWFYFDFIQLLSRCSRAWRGAVPAGTLQYRAHSHVAALHRGNLARLWVTQRGMGVLMDTLSNLNSHSIIKFVYVRWHSSRIAHIY